MSKTTTLYLSMIVVFIVGLWAIVQAGRGLRAPHDLAGTWSVAENSDVQMPAKTLAIAQSGKFVKLKVDGGPSMDLVLQSQAQAGTASRMAFKGGAQELTVQTPPAPIAGEPAGPYQFTLQGPVRGEYLAKRDAVAVKKSDAKH